MENEQSRFFFFSSNFRSEIWIFEGTRNILKRERCSIILILETWKLIQKVFMVMRIHDDEYPIANSIDRNLVCVLWNTVLKRYHFIRRILESENLPWFILRESTSFFRGTKSSIFSIYYLNDFISRRITLRCVMIEKNICINLLGKVFLKSNR